MQHDLIPIIAQKITDPQTLFNYALVCKNMAQSVRNLDHDKLFEDFFLITRIISYKQNRRFCRSPVWITTVQTKNGRIVDTILKGGLVGIFYALDLLCQPFISRTILINDCRMEHKFLHAHIHKSKWREGYECQTCRKIDDYVDGLCCGFPDYADVLIYVQRQCTMCYSNINSRNANYCRACGTALPPKQKEEVWLKLKSNCNHALR